MTAVGVFGTEVRSADFQRTRRLRRTAWLRELVREARLAPADLIYPLFVRHGKDAPREIASMPGTFQWPVNRLPAQAEAVAAAGIRAVILFGIPLDKDPIGRENFDPDGIVPRAIRALKDAVPDLVVITDVCLCEYTDHGHCGVLNLGDPRPAPHLPWHPAG
jgi:porphobilinogen synthase